MDNVNIDTLNMIAMLNSLARKSRYGHCPVSEVKGCFNGLVYDESRTLDGMAGPNETAYPLVRIVVGCVERNPRPGTFYEDVSGNSRYCGAVVKDEEGLYAMMKVWDKDGQESCYAIQDGIWYDM